MSLLYRLAVWELGEHPHTFVTRTQAEIDRETARQVMLTSRGIVVPDDDRDRLHRTQELVAIVKRNSTPKEKMD
ncbi:hypothetical protein pdul_cds_871 [Pandoravirus dulcis]|uniref:Uncharacterized protein n=1 Tax=Pandoravirus dulcis TaxID=1349409 RepID=A0A291AUE7_9VIRU|nr:hypothetical protein pdul_cds_871 [Pandoravirus dulcis]ATE82557.1 hypothetical protein pdul_cds_871 [Pandoravirus dulcis]